MWEGRKKGERGRGECGRGERENGWRGEEEVKVIDTKTEEGRSMIREGFKGGGGVYERRGL